MALVVQVNPETPASNSPKQPSTPSSSPSPGDERKSGSGRRSRFSPAEDHILVREVAASKAHVAAYGQTQALFETVSSRCNENEDMQSTVKWKQCQDRYLRLQESFDKEDGLTHLRSGMGGGQLSELNELLSQMREAREGLRVQKSAKKEKVAKDEEEKERIGRDLVAASLSRKRKLSKDYESGDMGDTSSDSGSGSRDRKRNRKPRNTGMRGELTAFGESLKESDLARVDLEREQLAFERHKFDVGTEERTKDREERKKEREEMNKLELEKLKAMLSAFRGAGQ